MKVIRSLSFAADERSTLREINSMAWPQLLKFTDRAQLTLPLGTRCLEFLPPDIRARIESNLANNRLRYERISNEYQLISGTLHNRSIDFVFLKGITQWPFYSDDRCARPQYDIDIYCPPGVIESAREALIEVGYKAIEGRPNPTDHFAPMIRCPWTWRGDYYAVDLPITIELHFQFWDEATECIPCPEVNGFWNGRLNRDIGGMRLPTLDPVDGIIYTSLHLVRHLLRGDLRPYHVYEMAHFLERTATNDMVWRRWRDVHDYGNPVLEGIAFRLAAEWFGPKMHPLPLSAIDQLSVPVDRWFKLFSLSPLRAIEYPNKDELLLHLSLVQNPKRRVFIAYRRLLPLQIPKVTAIPAPDGRVRGTRLGHTLKRTKLALQRARYHLRAMRSLMQSAFRLRSFKRSLQSAS